MYMELPPSALVPHPFNTNKISRMYLKKLRHSIAEGGLYETIVVRPHTLENNKFEVLNGHVRVNILGELGINTIKCDIWDVNDQEALQYLAILNKLRGSEAPELRMQLLLKLLAENTTETLAETIPETASYLKKLECLPEKAGKIPDSDAGLAEDIVIMHFYVNKAQYVEIMKAFETLQKQYGLNSSSEALFKLASLFLHKSE